VETGSKGVKVQAYRIGFKGDEFYTLQEAFRESINIRNLTEKASKGKDFRI
jgi:hypothetical protein